MKTKGTENKAEHGQAASKRVTRNGARRQQDEDPVSSRNETRLVVKESAASVSYCKLWRNRDLPSREMDHSLEESLLAFFDTHGVRDPGDIEEDRLTFLDAAYARSIVQADASVPTKKMYHAMFHSIQENQSLELMMESFQLLKYLEKRHPQVAIAEELDETSDQRTLRLDVDNKIWSPLEQTIEEMGTADVAPPASSADEQVPMNLLMLVETIATNIAGQEKQHNKKRRLSDGSSCHDHKKNVNILGQFLILQHLVSLAEKDFYLRLQVSEATRDTSVIQKSFLYELLRKLDASKSKKFLVNLSCILNPIVHQTLMQEEEGNGIEGDELLTSQTSVKDVMATNKSGLLPSPNEFSHLAYKLLFMVLEIARINGNKKSSEGGLRRKQRFSFDNVSDLFSNRYNLEAFLEALDKPCAKLKFIVEYFVKYAPPNTVVRGLDNKVDGETMEKLLTCFDEEKIHKFVHKFSKDSLPILLGHAFQAFVIIHAEEGRGIHENERGHHQSKLMKVCQSLSEALTELQELERQPEMLPVAEGALRMAQSILSPS